MSGLVRRTANAGEEGDTGKAAWSADRGSVTVVWLAALLVCLMFGTVAFALTEFASARARVSAAADLAALAAANRTLFDDGCERAAAVARANDAEMESCRVDGMDAVVTVAGRARGALDRLARAAGKSAPRIVVEAKAGQPESVT